MLTFDLARHILGGILLGLAGLISVFNGFTSFVRPTVVRLLGWPQRNVSGVPLLGSIALLPAVACYYDSPSVLCCSLVLLVIDTGGVVWLAVMLAYMYIHRDATR